MLEILIQYIYMFNFCAYVIVCMIDRQYSSYCFLVSELLIEKKIKYSRQAAYDQSMGFAIDISHAQ